MNPSPAEPPAEDWGWALLEQGLINTFEHGSPPEPDLLHVCIPVERKAAAELLRGLADAFGMKLVRKTETVTVGQVTPIPMPHSSVSLAGESMMGPIGDSQFPHS